MPNIVLYKIEKANSFKMIHECEIDCNLEGRGVKFNHG